MAVVYRPRLSVDRAALAPDAQPPRGSPEFPRVLDVDEDEATMAVEAVRALLAKEGVHAGDVDAIAVVARPPASWIPIVGEAVLGDGDRAMPAEAAEKQSRDALVVRVRVEAYRPGSPRLAQGASSSAVAWIGSDEARPAAHEPAAPRRVGAEDVLRLAAAEAGALGAATMGAYIPQATWALSKDARYRLVGARCRQGHVRFPSSTTCAECGAEALPLPLPRRGSVHTFTVIASGGGPTEFDFLQEAWGAYGSLVYEPEGMPRVRVPGLWTDAPPEDLALDAPVEPVFRRLYAMDGAWRYGTKFRPRRA